MSQKVMCDQIVNKSWKVEKQIFNFVQGIFSTVEADVTEGLSDRHRRRSNIRFFFELTTP